MRAPNPAVVLALLGTLSACDVTTVVGENDGALSGAGPLSCPAGSVLRACATEVCVVSELVPSLVGSIALAADDERVFYQVAIEVLVSHPVVGGAPTELVPNLDALNRLTSDESSIYWTENSGKIWRVDKDGGPPLLLPPATQVPGLGNPFELTVDAEHVYAVMPAAGNVVMVSKESGPETHLPNQGAPVAIAADGAHVYWADAGTSGPSSGRIIRAARGDLTTAEVFLSNLEAPTEITVGETDVFWTTTDALFKVAKKGGEPRVVTTGLSETLAIAAFEDFVYMVGASGLTRAPVAGGPFEVLDVRSMSALSLSCSGIYTNGWGTGWVYRFGK
jgi:hypothetical protein